MTSTSTRIELYEEFRNFLQKQLETHPVEFWQNHELYLQALYATKAFFENQKREEKVNKK